MIKYTLKCANDHQFDSWFRDSSAYEELVAAGKVTCVVCGQTNVEKAMMAPQLQSKDAKSNNEGPLSVPASPAETALRELRSYVEANADNVGDDFAKEARQMHDGDAPERAIYGRARLEEAKSLIEDGVPVAPLPWPSDKTN